VIGKGFHDKLFTACQKEIARENEQKLLKENRSVSAKGSEAVVRVVTSHDFRK